MLSGHAALFLVYWGKSVDAGGEVGVGCVIAVPTFRAPQMQTRVAAATVLGVQLGRGRLFLRVCTPLPVGCSIDGTPLHAFPSPAACGRGVLS